VPDPPGPSGPGTRPPTRHVHPHAWQAAEPPSGPGPLARAARARGCRAERGGGEGCPTGEARLAPTGETWTGCCGSGRGEGCRTACEGPRGRYPRHPARPGEARLAPTKAGDDVATVTDRRPPSVSDARCFPCRAQARLTRPARRAGTAHPYAAPDGAAGRGTPRPYRGKRGQGAAAAVG